MCWRLALFIQIGFIYRWIILKCYPWILNNSLLYCGTLQGFSIISKSWYCWYWTNIPTGNLCRYTLLFSWGRGLLFIRGECWYWLIKKRLWLRPNLRSASKCIISCNRVNCRSFSSKGLPIRIQLRKWLPFLWYLWKFFFI